MEQTNSLERDYSNILIFLSEIHKITVLNPSISTHSLINLMVKARTLIYFIPAVNAWGASPEDSKDFIGKRIIQPLLRFQFFFFFI